MLISDNSRELKIGDYYTGWNLTTTVDSVVD